MVLGRNWRRSAPVNIARTINGLKAPIFASLRPLDIWFKGSIQVGNWPELARILLSSRAAVRSSHRFLTTPAKLYIADWKFVLAMLKMWPFKCSLGPILGRSGTASNGRTAASRQSLSRPGSPAARGGRPDEPGERRDGPGRQRGGPGRWQSKVRAAGRGQGRGAWPGGRRGGRRSKKRKKAYSYRCYFTVCFYGHWYMRVKLWPINTFMGTCKHIFTISFL
jgi:hypothetical protein